MSVWKGLVWGDMYPLTDVTSPLSAEVIVQRVRQRAWLSAAGITYLMVTFGAIFLT